MPAEPKPAPTERTAPDEAEREEMVIEIEDGDEAKKAAETDETAAAGAQPAADGAAAQAEPASEPEPASAEEPEEAPAEGEAEAAEASAEPQESAADEIAKAKAEAADWHDKFLRLHAEWDTYRRRTSEQREAEKKRAAEKLITSLLPVIDDFERTIDYAKGNGEAQLLDGVVAVHTKLVDVLVKDGVEVIDPAGDAFDALQHQAVATVDDASVPDETVHEVYQKGYKLGEKVLRPAMVTVTTGGPKREKPAEANEE